MAGFHRLLVSFLALSPGVVLALDLAASTAPLGAYVTSKPLVQGAGLRVVHFDGTVLWEQYWEGFTPSTVIPVASASKWLSGAAVMSVVDDGLLSLDTTSGSLIPEFAPRTDGGASMTVRQLFSHTSGLPGDSRFVNDTTITLAESARRIALFEPLQSAPGAEFRYGGASMQVAGRMAEIAAATPWETLVDERLLSPLGIEDTDYQGLGPTTNPRVAGSVRTSMNSYERVLRTLADGGVYNGQRVLSGASVGAILADQTGSAVLDAAPPTVMEYLGYGVGTWVLREDATGAPALLSSPGAFGTNPWIDLEHRYFAVFFVDGLNRDVAASVAALQSTIAQQMSLVGDYTLDGLVDIQDLALWQSEYGKTGWSRADGNRDGRVDAADYTLWRDAAFSAAVAVPEPSSLLLLAAGTLALTPHKRRPRPLPTAYCPIHTRGSCATQK
jgi:CubicO group peptidase (beta-lactamase class C family)